MVLEWTKHDVLTEMQESRYKNEYLRIVENGPGDFIGYMGTLDHEFFGDTAEDVEKQLMDFVG
jgi:hypothetical protein